MNISTVQNDHHNKRLCNTAVIIPALNEEQSLAKLLPTLTAMQLGQIIVADNGSTDQTAVVSKKLGAELVAEPIMGYGAACWTAIQTLKDNIDTVVFLDADLSDDPTYLPILTQPIFANDADLVIGSRQNCEAGAMTLPQRFGNWLATSLIHLLWGYHYHDLGPFRVITRQALNDIDMKDRAFGWTVEMQIRAIENKLRIQEIAVPYRMRIGKSKISGTVMGVYRAGTSILGTIFTLYCNKSPKLKRQKT